MYSCIQSVGLYVFLFFLPSPPTRFSFSKMHVGFFFSVFLNVILVSYKSEIAFQQLLTPEVFLSK